MLCAERPGLARKRQIAAQISNAIWRRRPLLGELQQRMQLPDDLVRGLYLRTDEPQHSGDESPALEKVESASALDLGGDFDDGGFDLFGDSSAPTQTAPSARNNGSDADFAQAVLREWVGHLRHLPEDMRLMSFLGFDRSAIEALIDELIEASLRTDLKGRLLDAVTRTEQIGTRREQLAGRQVLAARTVLADFIAWLGFIEMPLEQRPDSRVAPGRKLFEPVFSLTADGLPKLSAQSVDHAGNYVKDWLVGIARLAEENVGHSAGREITLQQNTALGRILAVLRGEQAE